MKKESKYLKTETNHFAIDLKLTQHCKSTIMNKKIYKNT